MSVVAQLQAGGVLYRRVPNSAEIVLNCPQCLEEGHHESYDKLYYNLLKRVGECKRCGHVVVGNRALMTLLQVRSVPQSDDWLIDVPEAKPFFNELPIGCVEARENFVARLYLCGRGLSIRAMQQFGLMYCQEGFYAGRIIIPVVDHHGNYRTFVARTVSNQEPKYRYPKGSMVSSLLYNLCFRLKQQKSILLVEGVFDAIHTFPFSVATFGKHLSDAQVDLLRLTGVEEVFLVWDAEAWQETPELCEKAVKKLSKYFLTTFVRLPHSTPTEFSIAELKRLCMAAER